MSNLPRALYESIRTGGVDRIRELYRAADGETPFLDFKESHGEGERKGDPPSELTKSGRQVFGKAASAFANSDGGVIVWGVEAKDNKDPVERPIPHPRAFVQSLNAHTANILEPGLSGIEHVAIDLDDSGKGFVASYIPKSGVGPQVCLQGERTPYMRLGSNSVPMPLYVLRSMILATTAPKLEVALSGFALIGSNAMPRGNGRDEIKHTLRVIVGVKNSGLVLATRCALAMSEEDPRVGFSPNGTSGRKVMLTDPIDPSIVWPGRLYPLPIDSLYPSNTIDFGEASTEFFADEIPEVFRFRYAIFAEHFVTHGIASFSLREIWPHLPELK